MTPALLITIEGGDWPPEAELAKLTERAVTAAITIAELAMPRDAELSLLFSNDRAVQAINGEWRGKDSPTNVLSFPGADVAPGEAAGAVLGDIVLACETVKREAELEQKPFKHHLTHLIVHGFLHLFGYDHLDDEQARIMEGLETQILHSLAIADPHNG